MAKHFLILRTVFSVLLTLGAGTGLGGEAGDRGLAQRTPIDPDLLGEHLALRCTQAGTAINIQVMLKKIPEGPPTYFVVSGKFFDQWIESHFVRLTSRRKADPKRYDRLSESGIGNGGLYLVNSRPEEPPSTLIPRDPGSLIILLSYYMEVGGEETDGPLPEGEEETPRKFRGLVYLNGVPGEVVCEQYFSHDALVKLSQAEKGAESLPRRLGD